MSFSDRYGYKPATKAIQLESLDQETKNGIWNIISAFFHEFGFPLEIYQYLWAEYFKMTRDTVPQGRLITDIDEQRYYFFFREYILKTAAWNECFDFLEFLVIFIHDNTQYLISQASCSSYQGSKYFNIEGKVNSLFEQESVGYRFSSEANIVPITSEVELNTIDEAAINSSDTVGKHIKSALNKLTDRKAPDYPNAVKEAISAVEAQCCLILGKKATLGDALKKIEETHPLHPCLREAFSKLYGYTNDAGGIRHGSIQSSKVDFDLAKFMLVTCSAFINYLKSFAGDRK